MSGRVNSIINDCKRTDLMKDFPNASFPPETLAIMKEAMDAAVASLPDPISSTHVQSIAETILRTTWRKRPSYFAADGAVGAADCAARLTYHKRYS